MRVKISSEAAGAIALSPVVARELPLPELVSEIVAVVGKDRDRLSDTLRRGTFASGASRFRWEGFDVTPDGAAELLARFPDPDPSRPFLPGSCVQVLLRGGASRIPIDRDPARRRRWFRRRSFWDELLELAGTPDYAGYSYRERADVYRVSLPRASKALLVEAARLSPYTSLPRQIEAAAVDIIEYYVKR